MTNKEKVLEAYKKYVGEFDYEAINQLQEGHEQFYLNESEFLYCIVRMIKPKKILEVSPDQGFTTNIILSAMKQNDIEAKLFSFDIHNQSLRHDRKEGKFQRELILGNAKKTITKEILAEMNFILVDSDHSYSFGLWYAKLFRDSVKPGTFIMVHDWPQYASNGATNNIIAEQAPPAEAQKIWNLEVLAVKQYFIEKGYAEPVLNVTDWLKESKKPYHHLRDGVMFRALSPSQILIKT